MQSRWSFILANSSDLSTIGELTSAQERQLTLALNAAGSLSFRMNLLDSLAWQINALSTCILAIRDGTTIWSGPVWTIEESGRSSTVTVNCQGWIKLLDKRLLKAKTIYTAQNPSAIAFALLAAANADQTTRITAGAYSGAAETARNRTYERNSNIGTEISAMSQIENGYDYEVTPTTRILNIYDKKMTDRPNAQFGYGWGPDNLDDASRTIDSSETCNRFIAVGKNGLAQADDAVAQAAIGLFEEVGNLSDVANSGVLTAYAGAEVLIRAYPRQTFSVTPRPYSSGSSVPQLFRDYYVGDKVYFTANRGRMQVANQAIRVFAATVSLDESGGEHVSNLQLTA